MSYVSYNSNNSGGHWWLTDSNWYALEKEGWEVEWRKERWLGSLATNAVKRNATLREAVESWEKATGECATETGCACCGQPHYFTEYDEEGNWTKSGPTVRFTADWDD